MTFKPSPGLKEFYYDQESAFTCLRAANRVGKTFHACHKGAKFLIENPESRVRLVGPTKQQAQDVIGRYMASFLVGQLASGSYYVDGKGWNSNTIRLKNGSICQLKSFEDHPNSHAGDELDLIIMDEPPTKPIFAESMTRLVSRDGKCVIALTPVGRPVEWFRELVEADGSKWKQYVVAFTRENCPWYTEGQYQKQLDAIDSAPWERAQRLYGDWEGAETDRKFMGFTEQNEIKTVPNGNWRVCLSMDHGEKMGSQIAHLILYNDNHSHPQIIVADEYVSPKATTPEEDADYIIDMLNRNGVSPDSVDLAVGDINFGKTAGVRINELLLQNITRKLHRKRPPFQITTPLRSQGAKEWSMRCMNHALRRNDMKVLAKCTFLKKGLKYWKGQERGKGSDVRHAIDACRYGVLAILGSHHEYRVLKFH